MKKTWWKEAVCYQIYPRSFMDTNGDGIGDIQGIISKLDYFCDLGVDVLWICPVYPSPNADNGYDISDYQGIAAEFGTMGDFDQLLQEAHSRGLKIIMDLVVNHTSDEHPWFIESRSRKDHPRRDWYIWRDGKNGTEPNNWESIFSGSAWTYDEPTDQYYLHLFDQKQPDLNWENSLVREAVSGMINWWLEKGIDGFRVDAITHIKKRAGLPDLPNPTNQQFVSSFPMHTNQEGILEHLCALKAETYANYDVMTVGEANGVTEKDASDWVGEDQGIFNMIFQFEQLGIWESELSTSQKIINYKKVLTKWQTGLHQVGWNALYLENHDQPRSVSIVGNDQTYWSKSAKMLAALYFLMQGTPFIYQGQEIGMTNVQFDSIDDYNDVRMKNHFQFEVANGAVPDVLLQEICRSSRDNARTPMQWNAKEHGGFSAAKPWIKVNSNYSTINVEAQIQDEQSIYHFYKKLIQLRKQHPVLIYGDYQLLFEEHSAIFAYSRSLEQHRTIVICNMTDEVVEIPELVAQNYQVLLGNYPDSRIAANHRLAPYEAVVLYGDV